MSISKRPISCPKRNGFLAFGCAIALAATPGAGQDLSGVLDQVLRGRNFEEVAVDILTETAVNAAFSGEAAMPGDRRLLKNGAGLALTRDELGRAARAAEIFGEIEASADAPAAPAYVAGADQRLDAELLDRIRSLHSKKEKGELTHTEAARLEAAIAPFVLRRLIDEGQARGVGAIVVPARSTVTVTTGGYCADPSLAAPKAGEEFQLVPTATLIPSDLRPAYEGLLRQGASKGKAQNASIQGLIWTLRKVANGTARGTSLNLSAAQRAQLLQADPNAIAALEAHLRRTAAREQMSRAVRSGMRRLTRSANLSIRDVPHQQAIRDVAAQMRRLEAMPVVGGVRGANAAYSLLSANVAAHASTERGGASNVTIRLANAGDTASVFYPGSCLAQSTRLAQRLAIQPDAAPASRGPDRLAELERDGVLSSDIDVPELAVCDFGSPVEETKETISDAEIRDLVEMLRATDEAGPWNHSGPALMCRQPNFIKGARRFSKELGAWNRGGRQFDSATSAALTFIKGAGQYVLDAATQKQLIERLRNQVSNAQELMEYLDDLRVAIGDDRKGQDMIAEIKGRYSALATTSGGRLGASLGYSECLAGRLN